MRLSTRIFGLGLLAMAFLCAAGSAEAASFADYVYQNAKTGNIAGIKNYLRRGYSIDAVSPNGYTALCFAVDNNDYRAYSRIRNLGADETHSCMRRVNPDMRQIWRKDMMPLLQIQDGQRLQAVRTIR